MSKRPATLAPEAIEPRVDGIPDQGHDDFQRIDPEFYKTSQNGIFLYPGNLQALGKVMACQIRTYDELLAACTKLTTISVDGLPIQLDPGLIMRLKSRCINREFGPYLKEQIIRLLCGDIGF